MNRHLAIAFLGVALIVAGMVRADAAAEGDMKVGVVDLDVTLYKTAAGKRATKSFEQAREKKQAEFDSKRQELERYAAELEKQRSILKPEVLKQRMAELERKYVEVQELMVKLERDLANERAKVVQEVLKQAGPIIKELARKKGLTVVLDRSAVIWVDEAHDLTAQVNARMK